MTAPLVRPPAPQSQADLQGNQRGTAIGVLKAGRPLPVPGSSDLAKDRLYLVVFRGATSAQPAHMVFVFVPSGSNTPQEQSTSASPRVRRMSRDVSAPQAIMTLDALCFSWNRVQVCSEPSPQRAMTGSERNRKNSVMNAAVGRLATKGLLKSGDVNVDGALPDVEGTSAVNAGRGSMLAAPLNASAVRQARHLFGGSVAPLAPLVAGADVDLLIGVIRVDETIDIPNYPSVPPGDYAVRAKSSGGNWVAELTGSDGSVINLPAENVEVLGEADQPTIAVVNLAIIQPVGSPPISLCLFRERCA
jgi:hypothetical protein